MHGHCFCGQIGFEIDSERFKLYQCHCSQCRRQGGSSSNTATIVASSKFRWLQGKERISSWTHETGFRSDFCSVCGSPVPNPLKGLPYVWIPAGLLDDDVQLEIVAHVCVSSKAAWDKATLQGVCFEHLPELQEFFAMLDGEKKA
ncbi:MAG: aldehyde-activating protein [Sideroxydans sp.]|nr:aldehyde-activating protein [Sideroxydans sp.]